MSWISIGQDALRSLVLAFAAAIVLATAAGAAEPPMALKTDGYFYVGGKLTTVAGKQYMVGQMYVEYRIPAKQTHPYPVIMVHGGSMSGVNYTGTPDGREGWAQHFVRHGYAVYVVDQPGRGRSRFMEG